MMWPPYSPQFKKEKDDEVEEVELESLPETDTLDPQFEEGSQDMSKAPVPKPYY